MCQSIDRRVFAKCCALLSFKVFGRDTLISLKESMMELNKMSKLFFVLLSLSGNTLSLFIRIENAFLVTTGVTS